MPRRLKQTKRKTIGLRVPDNAVAQAILAQTGGDHEYQSHLAGSVEQLTDPYEMRMKLGKTVDMIVTAGLARAADDTC